MKTKILMVCLGNICRSPLAEELLASKVDPDKISVDSAGTADFHEGELPDDRSIAVAETHGLDIRHQRSRPLTPKDLERFDYIYVMDNSNFADVTAMANPDEERPKIKLILDSIHPGEHRDVPDPYKGGPSGFEKVFDLLDESTDTIAQDLS